MVKGLDCRFLWASRSLLLKRCLGFAHKNARKGAEIRLQFTQMVGERKFRRAESAFLALPFNSVAFGKSFKRKSGYSPRTFRKLFAQSAKAAGNLRG